MLVRGAVQALGYRCLASSRRFVRLSAPALSETPNSIPPAAGPSVDDNNTPSSSEIRFDQSSATAEAIEAVLSLGEDVVSRKAVDTPQPIQKSSLKDELAAYLRRDSGKEGYGIFSQALKTLENNSVNLFSPSAEGGEKQASPWEDVVRRSRTEWNFPIDNEVVKAADEEAGFEEHIFLEGHMKDWVPKDGPVRAFMDLVVHGLRKNPHLTAQRKREYMQQMKEHFEKFEDNPKLFPQ